MKRFLLLTIAAFGLTALNLGGPAGCGTNLSSNADLSSLGTSEGSLSPSFDSGTLAYNTSVNFLTRSLFVTPTAADGGTTKTYSLAVTRNSLAEQAYLKASNAETNDFFGLPVAISGNTLVVADAYDDSNATTVNGSETDNGAADAGSVFVFVRNDSGNWVKQAYLKASNAEAGDRFGVAVAVDGDTIVVGASHEDSDATVVNGDGGNDNAQDSGAAYVFVRDASGNWSQQAALRASNGESLDFFGGSVAVSGDTAVIGASSEDGDANGLPNAGAAYVFVRDGSGNWSEEAVLRASDAAAGDQFGYSVSISGDTVAAGAAERDGTTGAAYIFGRDLLGDWDELTSVTASNAEAGDDFGISVSISDDTVAVGADGESGPANGITWSGAVYVFQ